MRSRINEEEEAQQINEARSALRRRLNEKSDELRQTPEEPKEDKKSSRALKPGDVVQIKSVGVKATVLSVSPDHTVELRAGIMNVTAKEDEVYLLEGEKSPEAKIVRSGSVNLHAAVPSEIDLRGMDSLEAVMAAERYIDSAVMGKLNTVTIIHGKGTGALRKAVQDMLKRNKSVKSFRLGNFGEGEAGVTIVELK
jgi:DNA mismatch repair protein MutS2